MSYTIDKKTGDITWGGFAKGIGASPHTGIANIKNANISTEMDEVMCSFGRTQQTQTNTSSTGSLAFVDSSHVSLSFGTSLKGMWITVSSSSHAGELPDGNYFVALSSGGNYQLSNYYGSSVLSGFTSGLTANFTLIRNVGQAVAKATEPYFSGSLSSPVQQYRYYILDTQGLVWVYDTALASSVDSIFWFLPDSSVSTTAGATGLEVVNGWLHVFVGTSIYCKPTVNLADSTSTTTNWTAFASGQMLTSNTHFAKLGHQGKLYYTDGNYLGSIFPSTSLLTGIANIQSYASYTSSTTTGTIATLIGGSLPYDGTDNANRIPAVFFHALTASAANPTAVVLGTVYYIKYNAPTAGHFEVYAAASGGSALDLATGAVGTQYFSTYYPTSTGGKTTITFTPQRLNLPFYEIAQCYTEIGNNVLVGTKSNVMYPWNQIDTTPFDLVPLPENNVVKLLTVNNVAYAFAGNKGNVYVSNLSSASVALKVPDYCAGIAGTPSSYIEPYFVWGDVMYLRGRVYFSILDQTTDKAGNCGGIWSFIPVQNLSIEDVGMSLRLENINSYATYNGVCTVLLPSETQNVVAPQFWSAWYSSITSATYGIDFTRTGTSTQTIIEGDLVPTGSVLSKMTYNRLEYKLAAPLTSGESVTMYYRQNGTDSWTSLGTPVTESVTALSGYFPVNFEKGQWFQWQAILIPLTGSSVSFMRLTQVVLRHG